MDLSQAFQVSIWFQDSLLHHAVDLSGRPLQVVIITRGMIIKMEVQAVCILRKYREQFYALFIPPEEDGMPPIAIVICQSGMVIQYVGMPFHFPEKAVQAQIYRLRVGTDHLETVFHPGKGPVVKQKGCLWVYCIELVPEYFIAKGGVDLVPDRIIVQCIRNVIINGILRLQIDQ